MKFNITGLIELDPDYKIVLATPVSFTEDTGKVEISSTKDGLSISMEIDSNDPHHARAIAEVKLVRITNLLSWLHNLPIKKSKVTGLTYSSTEGNNHHIVIAETITITGHLSLSKGLTEQGSKELGEKLAKEFDSEFEEVALMWKEAVSEESLGLKFFLFFRILEHINGGSRKKADQYILDEYPQTELEKGLKNEDISIYTFLRDNIHAKSPSFPFEKIEKYLPQLQNIVRKAIEDKWN